MWLIWHCRKVGFTIKVGAPKLNDKVRTLGRRILPVVFGASLYQINLLIGTILATTISDGAVSYLYYADRVTQLPLGVVGIAVGTALLPMISRQLESGNDDKANAAQNRGTEIALLLTVPAAIALVVIPEPIISVLFERGAFGPEASEATASALMAYAIGLPAYVGIRVFTPGFFAREDTSTPVRIAAVSIIVNVVLNLWLMNQFAHVGIALASSISAWLNILLLVFVLSRRGHYKADRRLLLRIGGIIGASAIMAAILWFGAAWAVPWLSGSLVEKITALMALVVGGAMIYLISARVMGVFSIAEIKKSIGNARAEK